MWTTRRYPIQSAEVPLAGSTQLLFFFLPTACYMHLHTTNIPHWMLNQLIWGILRRQCLFTCICMSRSHIVWEKIYIQHCELSVRYLIQILCNPMSLIFIHICLAYPRCSSSPCFVAVFCLWCVSTNPGCEHDAAWSVPVRYKLNRIKTNINKRIFSVILN